MKQRLIKVEMIVVIAALACSLIGCAGEEASIEAEKLEQPEVQATTNEEANQSEMSASQDKESETSEMEASADMESEEQPEVQTYGIGETVETDIERLTLDKASLSVAVSSSMRIGYNAPTPLEQDFGQAVEYDPSVTSGQDVAEKGHTFVCVEFSVENLDRANKTLGGSRFVASVTVNGEQYEALDDGAVSSIDTTYWLFYNNATGDFNTSTDRIFRNVVAPGEIETVRAVIDIPVETEDLSSPFEITFDIPCSSGEAIPFTFAVN